MANRVPSTVFLAGSTVEVISALACIAGLGVQDVAVFIEHNISFKTASMDSLLDAARVRFPTVRFVELTIERPAPDQIAREMGWNSFLGRWRTTKSIHQQLDAACRSNFGLPLQKFGAQVQEICFTALHDYVQVFLAWCSERKRVFYPHSFDHPRRQHVTYFSYLVRRRSPKTAVRTFALQKRDFGYGGLVLGMLGRLLPGIRSVCLPFTGVDRVFTFRTGIDFVPNEVTRVPGLEDIFRWLLGLRPWAETLREIKSEAGGPALLLLLPECDRHPIWEKNCNFGPALLHLLRTASVKTGLKRIVIKAHVRSDGSAAKWLASFLKVQEQEWKIEVLAAALHGLPVEALALTGEFAAACSLGSCSLPPGLGFGLPHYVCQASGVLFDEGWREPFWMKYEQAACLLAEEGICRGLDAPSKVV